LPPGAQATEKHQDPGEEQRWEGVEDQLGTTRIIHGLKECADIAKEVVTGLHECLEDRELLFLVFIPTLDWPRQRSVLVRHQRLLWELVSRAAYSSIPRYRVELPVRKKKSTMSSVGTRGKTILVPGCRRAKVFQEK
jgi:hypothetical protein